MKHYDADSYFAKRAPRYQAALRTLPSARALDLLPYCAVVSTLQLNDKTRVRVADAFGGTGFLARGLASSGFEFVVCDCCEEMLGGATQIPHVQLHETRDDFQSVLASFGHGYFDLVFSHGGIHHVVDMNGSPNVSASRLRQVQVARRLAKMVRPGGALIIADIPEIAPVELAGLARETALSEMTLKHLLGDEAVRFIAPVLDLSGSECSLDSIHQRIRERLSTPVNFPVPMQFFDQYVACKTPIGHVAVYLDYDDIHKAVLDEGLSSLGRLNYLGPWLFRSKGEAGWFFKEKFCVGQPRLLGEDLNSEMEMFDVVREFLGACVYKAYVAVNWGVTYAIYSRL